MSVPSSVESELANYIAQNFWQITKWIGGIIAAVATVAYLFGGKLSGLKSLLKKITEELATITGRLDEIDAFFDKFFPRRLMGGASPIKLNDEGRVIEKK